MKTKVLTVVCVLAGLLAGSLPAHAARSRDPGAIAVDALIGRPACLVATIVGSAIFVVSLPVAATSGSIDDAAHALVVKPARATFVRPLGDFGSSEDSAVTPSHPKRYARSIKGSAELLKK